MSDKIVPFTPRDADKDTVENLLRVALERQATNPAQKAVLILVEETGKESMTVLPMAAGVTLLESLGVLAMGKNEILFEADAGLP